MLLLLFTPYGSVPGGCFFDAAFFDAAFFDVCTPVTSGGHLGRRLRFVATPTPPITDRRVLDDEDMLVLMMGD